MKLTNKEAIEVIQNNYPPSHYSMLRQALDQAIEVLKLHDISDIVEQIEQLKAFNEEMSIRHNWYVTVPDEEIEKYTENYEMERHN